MTLGETGQIHVSEAAAYAYLGATGCEGVAEARRQLTELLLDARQNGVTRTGAESWRRRSRTVGWDVQATVVRDGRLAIVTAVSVRPVRARR